MPVQAQLTPAHNDDLVGTKRKRNEEQCSDKQQTQSASTHPTQANPSQADSSSDDDAMKTLLPSSMHPSKSTSSGSLDSFEINLDDLEDETRCSVCLSIINNTRLVSVCMHRFCAACIETWLRNSKSNSCPACRKPLQSRRDCKPDPRFDELLRLLYGSVEDYEEDVLMPLAEEATAV